MPAVDVLVNNLGIFGAQPALEITDDDWRRYFEVNVLSAIRLIRTYLPGMTERGWGRVLNIASDSAVVDPGRDDPLRHVEDRAAGRLARLRQGGRRHRASPSTP